MARVLSLGTRGRTIFVVRRCSAGLETLCTRVRGRTHHSDERVHENLAVAVAVADLTQDKRAEQRVTGVTV